MTRKPETEKQKKNREKYKSCGKPNPKAEERLRMDVILQNIRYSRFLTESEKAVFIKEQYRKETKS